jgi:hypothetical protein
MNYAIDMAADIMIYIPNFIIIGSGVQSYWGRGWGLTHSKVIL